MGMYLNPGNGFFKESLRSKIYVDKTGLIEFTNEILGTEQKNVCISRPRRFGKSMAIKMLAAYYDKSCESSDMFRELNISNASSYREHLNRYDVILMNMQKFLSRVSSIKDMVDYLQETIIKEVKSAYPEYVKETRRLSVALAEVYANTQSPFIILIDEWDCIFREYRHDTIAQTKYLDFLRELLKDVEYVGLSYMTGILPIKKYGTHSALNMFSEFSMTNPKRLAQYVGFTEEEVYGLCQQYHMDFTETQRWYDGYCFRRSSHIYSPQSVVYAMWNEEFDSYWTQTETYEALRAYIAMNYDGLKDSIIMMLGGEKCRIDTGTFQNDMTTFTSKDDVLTLLIHLGYLAYDMDSKQVFIPNEEVRAEFIRAIKTSGWTEVINAISESEQLLEATWAGNESDVANYINDVYLANTSILTYNNENSLSCVISLAYYSARDRYHLIREMPAGKGFADIVFLPRSHRQDIPAMIIELKWNLSAEGAIKQIKSKQYLQALEGYVGEILLVGINYDKDSKEHQCIIEKINRY